MFNFIKHLKNRFMVDKVGKKYLIYQFLTVCSIPSIFKDNSFEDVGFASRESLKFTLKQKDITKKLCCVASLMTHNRSCEFEIPHKYFSALFLDLENSGTEIPLGALIMYNDRHNLGFSRERVSKYVEKYTYENWSYTTEYVVVGMLQNSFDFTKEMFFDFLDKTSFFSKDDCFYSYEDILLYNSKVDLLIDFYASETNKEFPFLTKEEFVVVFSQINLESKKLDEIHKEKVKIILSHNLIDIVLPLKYNRVLGGVAKI